MSTEKLAPARAAWGVADSLMEGQRPPSVKRFVGEYCSERGATPMEAQADCYRAVRRSALSVDWWKAHVRVVPATGPPGGEGGPEPDVDSDAGTLPAIRRRSGGMHDAILQAHGESGLFSRAERFIEFARFWDAVEAMENHGVDLTTVHSDSVLCRSCGRAAPLIEDHLEVYDCAESVAEYRSRFPVAPAEPGERSEMPPLDLNWRGGRDRIG